eukprot:CAMPEP_0182451920 /NCGR_PEP_ID=MMETSP1172-20130603/43980_1 /TAXON_ID=708627 /ORGANISM="Timspurckia oligopyrenoides, Strain CCMP3278" /LENGTH=328 /DNA_ID=CAMNT_0024649727 /DNA_START=144 /DNA_END=1130 /DNA_ORIENTATION=+
MFTVEGRNRVGVSRDPSRVRRNESASNSSIIQIAIQAHSLPNADKLSLSDPFCVLFEVSDSSHPIELLRTETVWNDLDPKFVRTVDVAVSDDLDSILRVEVYDRDSKSELLDKHDFLGGVTFSLSELNNAQARRLKLKLVQPDARKENKAWVTFLGTQLEFPDDQRSARIQFRSTLLRKKAILPQISSISMFYVISQARDDAAPFDWSPVYRSEVLSSADGKSDGAHLVFSDAKINFQSLNNSRMDQPNKLELYVFHRDGQHELVGHALFSVQDMYETETPVFYSDFHSGESDKKIGVLKSQLTSCQEGVFSFQLQADINGSEKYKPL